MSAANPTAFDPWNTRLSQAQRLEGALKRIRALESENAALVRDELEPALAECRALKAELAARPNYGTASNHSVWALQRDRIHELEARVVKLIELCERASLQFGPEDADSAWHRDFAHAKKEATR
jgi:hypothetical protein